MNEWKNNSCNIRPPVITLQIFYLLNNDIVFLLLDALFKTKHAVVRRGCSGWKIDENIVLHRRVEKEVQCRFLHDIISVHYFTRSFILKKFQGISEKTVNRIICV